MGKIFYTNVKAKYKIEVITKCLNDGWIPNWKDRRICYPKFEINENAFNHHIIIKFQQRFGQHSS